MAATRDRLYLSTSDEFAKGIPSGEALQILRVSTDLPSGVLAVHGRRGVERTEIRDEDDYVIHIGNRDQSEPLYLAPDREVTWGAVAQVFVLSTWNPFETIVKGGILSRY